MPFKFGVDSSGNYGYIKDGADTVTPFRTGNAVVSDVLAGKTFANATSPNLTGTMPNIKDIDNAISSIYVENGSSGSGIYARMNVGAHIATASSGYPELFIPQDQIAGIFIATATPADITNGKTAYVNGVMITGTRPAIVSKQIGSFTLWIALTNEVVSKIVTFDTPFDKVPTISVVITQTQNNTDRDDWQIVEVSKTYFKFSTRGHNWKYCTIGVDWVAEA